MQIDTSFRRCSGDSILRSPFEAYAVLTALESSPSIRRDICWVLWSRHLGNLLAKRSLSSGSAKEVSRKLAQLTTSSLRFRRFVSAGHQPMKELVNIAECAVIAILSVVVSYHRCRHRQWGRGVVIDNNDMRAIRARYVSTSQAPASQVRLCIHVSASHL